MPWYANQQIPHGATLAYDVGHIVPPTNVERHGYDRDGLVDWVEPGEHYQAEPAPSPQMGVFLNAPVQPDTAPAAEPTPASEAPVKEGARDLAEGDAPPPAAGQPAAPVKAIARSKTKPSDGATTTPEG